MDKKEKYIQEYILKTSAKVIFRRISTASGLMEWFADNVFRDGDVFTFKWDGSTEKAMLLSYQHMVYARFRWIDDEDKDAFFEFKLAEDGLTNDLTLIITDFEYSNEIEEAKKIWDASVGELKHNLGI